MAFVILEIHFKVKIGSGKTNFGGGVEWKIAIMLQCFPLWACVAFRVDGTIGLSFSEACAYGVISD